MYFKLNSGSCWAFADRLIYVWTGKSFIKLNSELLLIQIPIFLMIRFLYVYCYAVVIAASD